MSNFGPCCASYPNCACPRLVVPPAHVCANYVNCGKHAKNSCCCGCRPQLAESLRGCRPWADPAVQGALPGVPPGMPAGVPAGGAPMALPAVPGALLGVPPGVPAMLPVVLGAPPGVPAGGAPPIGAAGNWLPCGPIDDPFRNPASARLPDVYVAGVAIRVEGELTAVPRTGGLYVTDGAGKNSWRFSPTILCFKEMIGLGTETVIRPGLPGALGLPRKLLVEVSCSMDGSIPGTTLRAATARAQNVCLVGDLVGMPANGANVSVPYWQLASNVPLIQQEILDILLGVRMETTMVGGLAYLRVAGRPEASVEAINTAATAGRTQSETMYYFPFAGVQIMDCYMGPPPAAVVALTAMMGRTFFATTVRGNTVSILRGSGRMNQLLEELALVPEM